MKERASFTFDKETIKILELLLEKGKYRNRSHIVETAIKELKEKEEKEEKAKTEKEKTEKEKRGRK